MTTATVTATVNGNDLELLIRTPTQIRGETCESCGKSVPARYSASSKGAELFFCAHHIRKYSAGLTKQGFYIFPEDTSFTAEVLD